MNRKTHSRLIPALLLTILLMAAIICTGAFFLLKKESPAPSGGVGLQVEPNVGPYAAPKEESAQPSQGVAVPGWGSITIPADETQITVDFFNPKANAGQYYLTFELRLPDDSQQGYEVLYTSGLVEPELHIQRITLNRPLEAGTYEAVVHVQPYRMDEERTPTNNADMNTLLIVQ